MDFRQIEAFTSVAKYRSFSRAADAIYISQPTISAHINTLEKELGVTLFDRSGRDVQLTPAGMLLWDYAINMLNTRNQAVQSIAEFYNKVEGELHVSCSTTPAKYILPSLINGFYHKYPDVSFRISEMSSDDVISSILGFDAEIGIVGKVFLDDRLSYREFADDTLVLITPLDRRYPNAQGDYIEFKDILDEYFILREGSSATRQIFESSLAPKGYSLNRLKVICQASSMDTVLQLVKNGLGVTIISEGAAREYMDFNLIRRYYIKDLDLRRKIYMVKYTKRTLSPPAKAFENFVALR